MKLSLFGVWALLALMLAHSWHGPDIWYHLTWGRSLLEGFQFLPSTQVLQPQPIYANFYWLFQVLVYGVYSELGLFTASLLFGVTWLATTWLWIGHIFSANTKGQIVLAKNFLVPVLLFIFVVCSQLRFEARPEVLSMLFLILMIGLFAKLDPTKSLTRSQITKIILLQVLWVNVHGYFVFGPLICAALLISCLVTPNLNSISCFRRVGLLLLGLLIATLVNPFGYRVWSAVAAYAELGKGLRHINAELMPPDFMSLSWPLNLLWILLVISTIWSLRELTRRQNVLASLLSLAGAILLVQANRNIPLYLLLSVLVWRPLLDQLADRVERFTILMKWLCWIPGIAALVLCVSVASGDYFRRTYSLATFGPKLERASYPIAAVEFLRAIDFEGRIFCDSYDGGYIEFSLPKTKVAGDSYFSDVAMTLDYFEAIKSPKALVNLDQKLKFDALLINIENQDAIEYFWSNSDWKLVFVDSHRLMFFRTTEYSNLQINWNNVNLYQGEDLRHWVYSFAMVTWAGMALKNDSPSLARLVIEELGKSEFVPSTALRYIGGLAIKRQDVELMMAVKTLIPRAFESSPGDIEKIQHF